MHSRMAMTSIQGCKSHCNSPTGRTPSVLARSPHGDVLLEAGAEGAAGHLADLGAIGGHNLGATRMGGWVGGGPRADRASVSEEATVIRWIMMLRPPHRSHALQSHVTNNSRKHTHLRVLARGGAAADQADAALRHAVGQLLLDDL